MDAAELLRAARAESGLSVRALAGAAGVATSTVTRIETGALDPTTGMLSRLLDAAGARLDLRYTRSDLPRVGDLVEAWGTDQWGQDRPDWTRLRAFIDHLGAHPHCRAAALSLAPRPSGSGFMDNLLAGITEVECDSAGLPRPRWTRAVAAPPKQWANPGTVRMMAAASAGTPPQLAARNIILDAGSLWRSRETQGLGA